MHSYRVGKAIVLNGHGFIGLKAPETVQANSFRQAMREVARALEGMTRGKRVRSMTLQLDRMS